MKKLSTLLLVACLLFCSIFTISCNNNGTVKATLVSVSEHTIVIKVTEVSGNATLIQALNSVKGNDFNYEISGGMITSVNGITNTADWSYCWMIYTNDTDFSNNAWGSVNYNDIICGSAILGAEDLPLTANCYYVIDYTYFPPM